MPRKGETITLSLLPHHKEKLEEIALICGATWGDLPNISALLRMIADEELILRKPNSPIPSTDRAHYLDQLSTIKEQVELLSEAIANLEKL